MNGIVNSWRADSSKTSYGGSSLNSISQESLAGRHVLRNAENPGLS